MSLHAQISRTAHLFTVTTHIKVHDNVGIRRATVNVESAAHQRQATRRANTCQSLYVVANAIRLTC